MTAKPHLGAPVPEDDDARVAVLRSYGILDTDPEQAYDDLVQLAAAICGTPTAALTLVDADRQWFKAKVGLDMPETPRDQSFCAHAILQPEELLEVPDATTDARFAANPLVTAEEGIRFYAGTPLVNVDDQALGALCVVDSRPRRLTAQQRSALEALGRQVVAQLELRRTMTDIALSESRIRQSEARYRHLSLHDGLTGLANRAHFHQRLEELAGQPVGLCFVDLDRFKPVNDEHGHEAGDAVLRHVAAALTRVCPEGVLPARLGGDEFVVLCPGADDAALRALAASLEAAVEEPCAVHDDLVVRVGCSTGWTTTDGTVSGDDLVRRADRAMYDAKAARRRNRDSAGGSGEDLRRALDEDQLVVEYQPFWEVTPDGEPVLARVVGAEALVRWVHPERGLVPPDEFVPLAERTGLVAEIGRRVLDRSLEQLARWQSDDLLPEGFRMHVNLAAQQLHEQGLADDVADRLAKHGIPPQRLCLEVTESGMLDVREFTPQAARRLTALGVDLALDDFGTGFSSLTQLRTFPFSVVKVDRSFVAGLGLDDQDEAIVETVVQLAHRLGTSVVAEGVETLGQLQRLRGLGCTQLQGYLLGRPASAETWGRVLLPAGWRAVGAALPAPRDYSPLSSRSTSPVVV